MAGVHIAEALSALLLLYILSKRDADVFMSLLIIDIPYFRAFTMPWTKYVCALPSETFH